MQCLRTIDLYLLFYLLLVPPNHLQYFLFGLVLQKLTLIGGDSSPGCSSGREDVLIGRGEEAALLLGEWEGAGHLLEYFGHVVVSLALLSDLG